MEKIAACGDNCSQCPRYLAKTADELQAVAELWHRVGWRERIVPWREMQCGGCSPHKRCAYQLLDCVQKKKIEKCKQCAEFSCEKIKDMLNRSKVYEERCKTVCSKDEHHRLKVAFFQKEENLMK